MICPKCGAEYVAGFTRCYDCGVDLIDPAPEPEKRDDGQRLGEPVHLVTVFRSGDWGRMALAKSILQSAGVPFLARNETVQDWVGIGTLAGGFNVVIGPMEIQVDRSDVEDAHLLLKDLESATRATGSEDVEEKYS